MPKYVTADGRCRDVLIRAEAPAKWAEFNPIYETDDPQDIKALEANHNVRLMGTGKPLETTEETVDFHTVKNADGVAVATVPIQKGRRGSRAIGLE